MKYDLENMTDDQKMDYMMDNPLTIRIVQDVTVVISDVLGKEPEDITFEEYRMWNNYVKYQEKTNSGCYSYHEDNDIRISDKEIKKIENKLQFTLEGDLKNEKENK